MKNVPVDLRQRVFRIVLKYTDATEIRTQSRFSEDLHIDSLNLLKVVLDAEDAFDVDIPDEDVETLRTVEDMCKYLERKDFPVERVRS